MSFKYVITVCLLFSGMALASENEAEVIDRLNKTIQTIKNQNVQIKELTARNKQLQNDLAATMDALAIKDKSRDMNTKYALDSSGNLCRKSEGANTVWKRYLDSNIVCNSLK